MLKHGDTCPVCGQGTVKEKVVNEAFKYKGNECVIPDYHIFVCDVCEEELVGHESLKGSEKTLTDFRRKIDGLLTSDEIRAIRKRLGKTQKELAEMLDVGGKTFARYENGQVTQSRIMDSFLRMLDECPDLPDRIKAAKTETGYKSTTLEIEPMTWHEWTGNEIQYQNLQFDEESAEEDNSYAGADAA